MRRALYRYPAAVFAAVVHVPLLAMAIYALVQGFSGHVQILGIGLIATLISTILVVFLTGKLEERLSSRASGSEEV